MLARTMKTPEELGLLKHEYDALVTTLYMIEDGQIPLNLIHMRDFTEYLSCGTAHCLAGWANTIDANAFPELRLLRGDRSELLRQRLPYHLQRLFWIVSASMRWPQEEAPARLRTYLETGKCE